MRTIACALLILCLSGCSGKASKPVNNYMLPAIIGKAKVAYKTSTPVMVLSPVRVDELLENQGIVYYSSPTEVTIARHHLWGESCSNQLFNHLLMGLRQGQSDLWIAPDYPQASNNRAGTLMVNINQFNGTFEGDAVMSGEWVLLDKQGKIARSQSFNYREALKTDGYGALVDALSKTANHLITDLSQVLSESK